MADLILKLAVTEVVANAFSNKLRENSHIEFIRESEVKSNNNEVGLFTYTFKNMDIAHQALSISMAGLEADITQKLFHAIQQALTVKSDISIKRKGDIFELSARPFRASLSSSPTQAEHSYTQSRPPTLVVDSARPSMSSQATSPLLISRALSPSPNQRVPAQPMSPSAALRANVSPSRSQSPSSLPHTRAASQSVGARYLAHVQTSSPSVQSPASSRTASTFTARGSQVLPGASRFSFNFAEEKTIVAKNNLIDSLKNCLASLCHGDGSVALDVTSMIDAKQIICKDENNKEKLDVMKNTAFFAVKLAPAAKTRLDFLEKLDELCERIEIKRVFVLIGQEEKTPCIIMPTTEAENLIDKLAPHLANDPALRKRQSSIALNP